MYAKNKEWYSGSSSSSGREEWRPRGHQKEIKKLRAQFELHSKQGAGKSPEEPSEPARIGCGMDEGCRMEVEEEMQSRKKLDEQRRNMQRQMRDIDKLTFMEPAVREVQKEKFVCLLQEVERKRTDLLAEHQKNTRRGRRSCKACRTRKNNHLKEACASEEEMQKIDEEKEKMRARFQALSEKSGENPEGCKRSGRGDSDLASWRGKERKLCVAVKRMLLWSSHSGACSHDGSNTGTTAARLCSWRSQQSIWHNVVILARR